jgi:drug/metabolite transporter (DMT)-like permease
VFFVAIADWLVFDLVPSLATYAGGVMIMLAFALLARDELGNMKA